MTLPEPYKDIVLRDTGASEIRNAIKLQSLWSGYGSIVRLKLLGGPIESVIVKHVAPPMVAKHPRGWASDVSHGRKQRSYEVEANWYQSYSDRCGEECRVPNCYAAHRLGNEFLFVLEDLDAAGYSIRKSSLDHSGVLRGLTYLANFHARFLGDVPDGLWDIGTYWHLATRQDEWSVMPPSPLKDSAAEIDLRLSRCRFTTLVHGDAKVANFCFSEDESRLAAVDFQYVGGGCGMKDVAYFLGSCQSESECERGESAFLDHYFSQLKIATLGRSIELVFTELEREWRLLYPFAWADFTRFMVGWCPGHSKMNRYSRRITEEVVARL